MTLAVTRLLSNALVALQRTFDSTHGGFGAAPSSPMRSNCVCSCGSTSRFNDTTAHMVRRTLEKMARGGIYDQVGGGFVRYSVDERRLVPHFEKMLYDNALSRSPWSRRGRRRATPSSSRSPARRSTMYSAR